VDHRVLLVLSYVYKTSHKTTPDVLIDLANVNYLLLNVRKVLKERIIYINSRWSTRWIMGNVGVAFVRRQVTPKPLNMRMKESWQSTANNFEEMKIKSDGSLPKDVLPEDDL
jgi:hypothetical protein